MILLTYEYQSAVDSISGPGYSWRTKKVLCHSDEDLQSELREIQETLARNRHYWDHHYAEGSPYREKTFIPSIRKVRTYNLEEADSTGALAEAQPAYDAAYQKLEDQRIRRKAADQAWKLAQFEKLRAEFGDAV